VSRELDGARILVVGATGGLGRAVSLELVSRGAVLELAALSRENLSEQSILNIVQTTLDLTVLDAPIVESIENDEREVAAASFAP
jgi:NAD(P)-dependent dehydrogenase (short-subunit alcohol dehydrogenase family)